MILQLHHGHHFPDHLFDHHLHCLTSAFHLHINIEEKLLDLNILPIGKNNPKYLKETSKILFIKSWRL